MIPDERREAALGLAALLGASALWAVLPFYFRLLNSVTPFEIIAHRIVWSALILLPIMLNARLAREILGLLKQGRRLLLLTGTSCLIIVNWLAYVWAVTTGQVLEASLGYFLSPLVSVALGMVLLKERLGRIQLLAVALAAAGVAIPMIQLGTLPVISLVLGTSFSLYGILRKMLPVSPLAGLLAECLAALPVAGAIVFWLALDDRLMFGMARPALSGIMMLTGFVTVIPLFLFNTGAKRLAYTTVGLLFYIVPSLLFLEGVLIFGEPLSPSRAATFVLIWAALALYSLDGLRRRG